MKKVIKSLGRFKKVSNLFSHQNNQVPNQFLLEFENGKVFQSYDSMIAIVIDGKLYLTEKYDYSNTTSKYLNIFCGYTASQAKKEIEKGNIILLKS